MTTILKNMIDALDASSKDARPKSDNAIFFIRLKKSDGAWHFTDKARGLLREPLVAGIPDILEELLADEGIPLAKARKGLTVTFSGRPIPGAQLKLKRKKREAGGAWYEDGTGQQGWLCPALLKFFAAPPATLHVVVAL